MLRPAVLCLLSAVTVSAPAVEPGAAIDHRAMLKAGFGGAAVDATARIDYRLRLDDGRAAPGSDADHILLPHSRLLYRRTRAAASSEQVWSGPEGSWRLVAGQWAFLGPDAARPYRQHVAYHFLPLLLDPATLIEPAASGRLQLAPAGQTTFEVQLDPVTGRIAENHFEGGAIVRELDYRAVGELWWPMRFEVVVDGQATRTGRFERVRVHDVAELPPMPVTDAPPRLAPPAGDTTRLLGAGWLSGARNDYNLSLDGAERTLVFARSDADYGRARIWIAHREGEHWSAPAPVPFSDPRYRDSDPWLSPDGRTLYFISDRPAPGRPHREDTDIWRVRLHADGRFGVPQHLPQLASDGEELGPELHDGWLYFNSTRADGPATMALYRAPVDGDGFAAPRPLPAPFNDGRLQGDFTLSPDGRLAVFWSARDGSKELDLFASRREGERWSRPVRLPAPFNAPGLDFTPAFSADGRSLRFASVRKPGWLDAPEHVFNGQANLYVAAVTRLQAALGDAVSPGAQPRADRP